jgi:Domain of unknown function (DUF4962)/Heparinase II/III-like protein
MPGKPSLFSICYRSLLAAILLTIALPGVNAVEIDPETFLSSLDKRHPRLLLKDDALAELKSNLDSDEVLQAYYKNVIKNANAYITKATLVYKLRGPRLLHVSRDCMNRVYTLALAYRLTGEATYADKAVENMLTVCAFKDWHTYHYLDTAEMTNAVGLGYDWLYHYMDKATREQVKAGLIKHGMQAGVEAYKGKGDWWVRVKHNWNQVCNGGLMVGALAIAESDPKWAKIIVPAALKSLPRALHSYEPDGAWGEGPGYWGYATMYTVIGLAALETALGTDYGLSDGGGLAVTSDFPIAMTGPTGYTLNFADCGGRGKRRAKPCMFWLANRFNNSIWSDYEHETLKMSKNHASAFHLIYYRPPSQGAAKYQELDRHFRGEVEVAVMRSAWGDKNALFAGIKAGYNQVNHGHLDLGNFELDALGVRWARDLGSDDYNLPGYWNRKQGGSRWQYYRLNSYSHSVPLLDNLQQHANGKAKVVKFHSEDNSAFTIVDISSAYKERATKAVRGLALVANRKAVLVQDEFVLKQPCEVAWAMTTDAAINIKQDNIAILTLKGRKMTARILEPKGAAFSIESTQEKPPEKKNKGVRRLMVRIPNQKGKVTTAILLSPQWESGEVSEWDIKPLAQW